MKSLHGIADGGNAYRAPAQDQRPGPFLATLGGTLPVRMGKRINGPLTVALLTKCPKPEGYGYVELIAEGYQRQTLNLSVGRLPGLYGNATAIRFGPMAASGWPEAKHVAIFDGGNELIFYGRLMDSTSRRSDAFGDNVVEFEDHALQIKAPPRH